MMVSKSTRVAALRGACGVAALLALASPAAAQLAELEEIIVTAQKRQENLQEVPISVATIGGEKLENLTAGGADIRFLSARVPSVVVESSFGRTFPRFYIRGLGNTDFDLQASQPVSFILDEVVLESPILKGFPLFDVARVEVLRGPQGTLFGRNTPAGIISFVSEKPSQEAGGYARVAYGRWNAIDLEGAVGGAITDKISARLSILHQRRDDWVDNLFTGEEDAVEGYDETAGRLQFLYDSGAGFTALLNGHARSLDGTARVFRANIINRGDDSFVDGFRRDEIFQDGPNDQTLDTRGVTLKLEQDFGATTLTSITGYETGEVFSVGDIDGGVAGVGPGFIPFPVTSGDAINDLDQISEELRLSSNNDGPLNWQTGLFYFHEKVDVSGFAFGNPGNPRDIFRQLDAVQKNSTWAVFGQGSYQVTEQFKLTGGLRYTEDDKEYENIVRQFTGPTTVFSQGAAETDDSRISWDLSANYQATEDFNLYARVASGFRAPSIQGRTTFGGSVTTANSEKVMSYEAGVKSDLSARARVNLSAFRYTIKDQQFTAVGGTGNFTSLLNADKGVGYGFEADMEFLPLDNLTLTAGLSYNHTEIKDENLFYEPCGGGCTVTDPTVTTADGRRLAIIDGNAFPNAPRWIVNMTARYGIPVGEDGELFAYTDWAYKSRTNFFLYESREFQDARQLEGGLRVGYSHEGGRVEAAAFVRNITNDKSLEGGIDFNNLTGFTNEPRVWGVELGMKF
ncbi:MAG TPA: TonB-dependent receptor [Azospirillaceae bacterium]|nr:TonB-dependent receptor [Azospirillaceae bacterium]